MLKKTLKWIVLVTVIFMCTPLSCMSSAAVLGVGMLVSSCGSTK